MKTKKILFYFIVLLSMISLTSIFAYAAFGFTWWAPIEVDIGRALGLVVLHLLPFFMLLVFSVGDQS
ncbi:MAG TPA: hypothetical protein VF523_12925 [Burkholderiales bacterium]